MVLWYSFNTHILPFRRVWIIPTSLEKRTKKPATSDELCMNPQTPKTKSNSTLQSRVFTVPIYTPPLHPSIYPYMILRKALPPLPSSKPHTPSSASWPTRPTPRCRRRALPRREISRVLSPRRRIRRRKGSLCRRKSLAGSRGLVVSGAKRKERGWVEK